MKITISKDDGTVILQAWAEGHTPNGGKAQKMINVAMDSLGLASCDNCGEFYPSDSMAVDEPSGEYLCSDCRSDGTP